MLRRGQFETCESRKESTEVSEEEQNNLLKYLDKEETKHMRLQRDKMGADDFEPLTMISKDAFGEVEHVKAERNLLAEVDNNCIVKLYCSFQDEEYLYFIMEIGISTWRRYDDFTDAEIN